MAGKALAGFDGAIKVHEFLRQGGPAPCGIGLSITDRRRRAIWKFYDPVFAHPQYEHAARLQAPQPQHFYDAQLLWAQPAGTQSRGRDLALFGLKSRGEFGKFFEACVVCGFGFNRRDVADGLQLGASDKSGAGQNTDAVITKCSLTLLNI